MNWFPVGCDEIGRWVPQKALKKAGLEEFATTEEESSEWVKACPCDCDLYLPDACEEGFFGIQLVISSPEARSLKKYLVETNPVSSDKRHYYGNSLPKALKAFENACAAELKAAQKIEQKEAEKAERIKKIGTLAKKSIRSRRTRAKKR